MKALILAGGRGKRLAEISKDKNKCMVEVKGKPLIEYSLDCASQTNISEIVIVVGYKAEEITNTYGNRYKGKPIKYALQPEQRGLVHAIEYAKKAIGGEDFMLMLGDELMIKSKHTEMIKKYRDENLFALCGVVNVKDRNLIKKTYAVIQGEDNRIFRLIEKPSSPMNNVMGTGNCIFKNEIFSYIPQTPINQKRGEKELPDLIQCAIDDGKVVKSFAVCDEYFNLNFKEDIKDAESYFSHF
ncbi:MAG: nucleotidyltransferase family protein [Candidatus Nealsonbacteria bacterium]|nr:nucleotidyltransferase family protein [Candidatus Nealsonbacteria bacterium]